MLDEALKKLDATQAVGQKEKAMAKAVATVLQDFCRQDEEFAQAVVQGGSFKDCMFAVTKGVGNSISDLDAYKKAVHFYFPGADISVQMKIDVIGDARKPEPSPISRTETRPEKPAGIILNLEDFLL